MEPQRVDNFRCQDKIVVVTGGGSGIGLSYAKLARKNGARVVIIADLRLTGDAQEAIIEDTGITFRSCDVSRWADLQGLVDVSRQDFGGTPDIYIASAGVFEPPYSNFWQDPEPLEANGYAHVDINVNHPIKLTRLAIRASLGSGKQAVVILVASIAGYSKQYPTPLYSATKHAVVGFARSMGDSELLQGVRVMAVCPGIVSTPLWTTGTPGSGERFGITSEISITSETVAEVIHDAVESSQYRGGTILEVSGSGVRVIPEWNIDPPGLTKGKMAKGTDVPPEMIAKALRPILEVTERERGCRGQSAPATA